MSYFEWIIDSKSTDIENFISECEDVVINQYCLLLPLYDITTDRTLPVFALITPRWEVSTQQKTIQKLKFMNI